MQLFQELAGCRGRVSRSRPAADRSHAPVARGAKRLCSNVPEGPPRPHSSPCGQRAHQRPTRHPLGTPPAVTPRENPSPSHEALMDRVYRAGPQFRLHAAAAANNNAPPGSRPRGRRAGAASPTSGSGSRWPKKPPTHRTQRCPGGMVQDLATSGSPPARPRARRNRKDDRDARPGPGLEPTPATTSSGLLQSAQAAQQLVHAP